MVSLGANGNIKTYGMKHFICDVATDISNIETADLAVGSTVFVIATSAHYMLNSSKQWIQINLGSGGGDTPDIEYNGGDII